MASVMVARRSWRGASDCKSDVSAEWVRFPPPPLETRLSLLKTIDMGRSGLILDTWPSGRWRTLGKRVNREVP